MTYVFVAPAVCLCGLYLSTFLLLSSRQGSAAVSRVVSEVVAGTLDFEFLAIGRDLISARVFEARLQDLNGRTVVEARTLACRFSPGGLVRRRIILQDCEADDGRMLFETLPDGDVGLFQAIVGPFRPKAHVEAPPIVTLVDVELRNIDVLVAAGDLMLRFDSVDLRNGRLDGGRGIFEIDGDARADGGRVILSERLLGLGDGKGSWDDVLWDAAAAQRPWSAAYAEVPEAAEGRRGYLDLRFDEIVVDRLRLRDQDIETARVQLSGPDVVFDGRGLLRLSREQPKLARTEQAIVAYDGSATITIPESSSVLHWAVPGLFPADDAGRIEPMTFTGYGSVRFYEGATRLRAHDLRLGPWTVASIDTGITWNDGTMRLSDDTRVELFGGVVTGSGSMVPADGTWTADLCLDGVDVGIAAADLMGPGSALARGLAATATTSPATCVAGEPAGLRLGGDLTLKAFERAPAATTPEDKEIQPPMIAGTARGLELRWYDPPSLLPYRALRVSATASLSQRGLLSFGADGGLPLTVRTPADTLTFSGGVDAVTGDVTDGRVTIRSSEFGRWLPGLGIPAAPDDLELDASFAVAGPFGAPDLDDILVEATLPEDSAGLPASHLEARLDVDGDALEVLDLMFTSVPGDARIRGSVALFDGSLWQPREDPGLGVVVVLSHVDLGAVMPSAGVDAEFDATFGVSGTVREPRVDGSHLEVVDFRILGEPIDYLWVDSYTISNDLLAAESVLAVKGKGTLRGDIALDMDDRTVEGAISGRRFRLGEIRTALEHGVALSGDADFDLSASGSFDAPTLAGRVSLGGLRVEGLSVGSVAATLHTFDGVVEVAAEVATDFDLDARVPLDGSPWTVGVRFQGLPLDEHMTSLEGVFDRAAVSGFVQARLDPFGDTGYSATGRLTELDVRANKRRFDIPQSATLTWRTQPGDDGLTHHLELSELSVGTGGRYLDIGGTLDVSGSESDVDVTIAGQSDFSLLRFLPDLVVDAEGLANVALHVTGSVQDTRIDGEVTFDRARVAPRGLGANVRFGPGRLLVGDGRIRVPADAPLTGTVFGGDFTAWGDIGLDGVIPRSVDYRLFVTNLGYRIPDVANVTLTSQDLRFQAPDLGDYDTWRISGDVEVVDARYYEDIEVVGETVSFGGFGRTVSAFSLPVWRRVPAIGRMTADLTIHGRDRFLVENTIATAEMDLEFRTDLHLGGRFEAMELVGEMEALEGSTVTYRGQQFDVQSATLVFRGDRTEQGYPMPFLDAELTASIRPCSRRAADSSFDLEDTDRTLSEREMVYITATVRGMLPSDLSFQLDSTPFYDQRDQLSLILTGCTVDELTAGDAGGRTLEVVLAPVIDVVERNVEERLDIDTVDLIPTADGSAGISIQDDVSERFTWGLDANVGAATTENRQVIRGEYRLFDWLMVEVQEQTARNETITVDAGLRFRIKLD